MTDPTTQPQSLVINLTGVNPQPSQPAPGDWDVVAMTQVNRDDIAAIVGTKFEMEAKRKITAAVKAEAAVRAQLTAARKLASDLFNTFVSTSEPSPVIRKLKSCFDDISFTTDLTSSGSYVDRLPTDDWTYKTDAGSYTGDEHASIRFTCTLTVIDPVGASHRFTMHRNAGVPADLRAALTDISNLTTALTTAENAVLDARRELTNVASVERQAKAAMAMTALKSSVKGQAILDSLASINQSDQPLLPETNPAYRPNG